MSARPNDSIAARRVRRILEATVRTSDDAGGAIETWQTAATLWASIRFARGSERWRADRAEQVSRYEISLRRRAGVSAGMRFRSGPRVFGIVTAGNPDGACNRLVCNCEKLAS